MKMKCSICCQGPVHDVLVNSDGEVAHADCYDNAKGFGQPIGPVVNINDVCQYCKGSGKITTFPTNRPGRVVVLCKKCLGLGYITPT